MTEDRERRAQRDQHARHCLNDLGHSGRIDIRMHRNRKQSVKTTEKIHKRKYPANQFSHKINLAFPAFRQIKSSRYLKKGIHHLRHIILVLFYLP